MESSPRWWLGPARGGTCIYTLAPGVRGLRSFPSSLAAAHQGALDGRICLWSRRGCKAAGDSWAQASLGHPGRGVRGISLLSWRLRFHWTLL